MGIQKAVKNLGRGFIGLKQENERTISQSILIVDNGYGWIGYLESAIESIRGYFPAAEITVLTFTERMTVLQKDFSGLSFLLPAQGLRPARYQVALEMFKIRKNTYDFVVLLSLDASPLIVSLFLFRSKVALYNQWNQWWSLRLRDISELFKHTYTNKRTMSGLKGLVKRLGLFFVLLQRRDEELFRHSVLIVDNGSISFQHIDCIVQKVKDFLPCARISMLGMEERKMLMDKGPDIEFIQAGRCLFKRYRIARHMLSMRKNKYDYIILLSLDVSPIVASVPFMRDRVILFNRWQQWWSFKPVSMKQYLMIIPRVIIDIAIFIYLLFSVSWIFLKRSFNALRFGF
ncbi:MAG: hypothetical protein KKG01_03720 [Candidatus Omnitrophica bacterium]|nr:hypothetical protein [Candidatus Omnitrophota bacterium]